MNASQPNHGYAYPPGAQAYGHSSAPFHSPPHTPGAHSGYPYWPSVEPRYMAPNTQVFTRPQGHQHLTEAGPYYPTQHGTSPSHGHPSATPHAPYATHPHPAYSSMDTPTRHYNPHQPHLMDPASYSAAPSAPRYPPSGANPPTHTQYHVYHQPPPPPPLAPQYHEQPAQGAPVSQSPVVPLRDPSPPRISTKGARVRRTTSQSGSGSQTRASKPRKPPAPKATQPPVMSALPGQQPAHASQSGQADSNYSIPEGSTAESLLASGFVPPLTAIGDNLVCSYYFEVVYSAKQGNRHQRTLPRYLGCFRGMIRRLSSNPFCAVSAQTSIRWMSTWTNM